MVKCIPRLNITFLFVLEFSNVELLSLFFHAMHFCKHSSNDQEIFDFNIALVNLRSFMFRQDKIASMNSMRVFLLESELIRVV